MSEENRHISERIFAHYKASGGEMYYGCVVWVTRELDEAERRGADRFREHAVKWLEENKYHLRALEIRALPLEGPKDGRE